MGTSKNKALEDIAPIALFCYKRVGTLKRTVESLKANLHAAESILYIYSDGPKDDKDAGKVDKVREYIEGIGGFKKVHIKKSAENKGLAASIVHGVTEVLDLHGKVIVVEDDLVLSRYFLDYMNQALARYQRSPKVMHVAGYLWPIRGQLPETFFLRNANCWGWGTWKRAWDKLELDPEKLVVNIKGQGLTAKFDFEGSRPNMEMLEKRAKGQLDSWAILWYASVFLDKGLGLFPGRSLVSNIGFGADSAHNRNLLNRGIAQPKLAERPIRLDDIIIEENMLARKRLIEVWKRQNKKRRYYNTMKHLLEKITWQKER